jgi:simple sugar transport system permease protein
MIADILAQAAPLLFATLGALVSEYAGALAVFMEGSITIAAFACAAATALTGNPFLGIAFSLCATTTLLVAVALFTERYRANPFITGIAVNFLSAGLVPWLSSLAFGTRGVVPLELTGAFASIGPGFFRAAAFPAGLALAVLLALFLRNTRSGLALRVSGASPDALASRGLDPRRYRVLSWAIAAAFASLAGSALTLSLGSFVPSVSAGRGWTALVAVYLGYRNPLGCVAACLAFASASYATDVLQGAIHVPPTLILGLPYALSLAAFLIIGKRR